MAQRVDSFEKSFGFFLLELSYLLKEFVDLRKKMLKDDPIDPSNLGESIQKADKIWAVERSSILRNTIDNEDPANKKCVYENT